MRVKAMGDATQTGGLQVDPMLHDFVADELLAGLDLEPGWFWSTVGGLHERFGGRVEELLRRRDEFQERDPAWNRDNGAGHGGGRGTGGGWRRSSPRSAICCRWRSRRCGWRGWTGRSRRCRGRSWWCRRPCRGTR